MDLEAIKETAAMVARTMYEQDEIFCCVFALYNITDLENQPFVIKQGSVVIFRSSIAGLSEEKLQIMIESASKQSAAIVEADQSLSYAVLLMDQDAASRNGVVRGPPYIGKATIH